jgi:hypothetical protein
MRLFVSTPVDTRAFANLKKKGGENKMVLLASDYDKSRFFKAEDGERRLRIKAVTEELVGAGAEKEKKLVVWFTNDERGLVLNRVNNRTLRGAFGDDTARWIGRVIIIFPMMVEMRGKMVPGLRVRIPPPKHGGQAVASVKPKPSGNGHSTAAVKPKPPVDDELDEVDEPAAQSQMTDADEFDDEVPF